MIFGVDIHPQFQAGLDIEQVRREGFDFLAAKLSQGTTTYNSFGWLLRGQACGLLCMGYHYLEAGNEVAQARVFAAQLRAAGVPGMLDAEFPLPNGDTVTVAGIRAFLTAARQFGARVPLVYLPHWYWQRMGSPDLTGLPGLWASSYVPGTGLASDLVEAVTPRFWAPYGGRPVAVLQFTDRGLVAGRNIDVDVFPGTRDELATLLMGGRSPNFTNGTPGKDLTMELLPATAVPNDPNSDPLTWPQRNYDIYFDLAGGWYGGFAGSVGVQDWGNRTVDNTRGYLLIASWIMGSQGGALVPVDPVFTVKGGGRAISRHTPLAPFVAPAGAVGLSLNYAAPGGGGVAVGRSA